MKIEDGFDLSLCITKAKRYFIECPKAMTLVQHASLMDVTEVYCVGEDKKEVQVFIPKQIIPSRCSKMGAAFMFVKVALESDVPADHWLITYTNYRQGFLFSLDFFHEGSNTELDQQVVAIS